MSNAGDGKRTTRCVPLPFRTFGEILAHGLEVKVWCTRCKSWGRADLTGRQGQRFAGARFRCRCGGFGCPSIRPPVPVQFAPGDMIADLYCGGCVPPWEIRDVRLDRPPWSTVSGDAFLCPGCRRRVLIYQRSAVADGQTMAEAWPHLSPVPAGFRESDAMAAAHPHQAGVKNRPHGFGGLSKIDQLAARRERILDGWEARAMKPR